MPKDDGRLAFPFQINDEFHYGMSLREWYAGNAPDAVANIVERMTLVEARKYLGVHLEMWSPAVKLQIIAKLQFEYADAMIKEGKK